MLIKRSMSIAGHRTSIALEDAFWRALETIAEKRGVPLVRLIAEIDAARATDNPSQSLASAVRVFVLLNDA